METIYKAIDLLYEEAQMKIDENWKSALGAGALAAGMMLSPMSTGDAQAAQPKATHQIAVDNTVQQVVAGEGASEGEVGMQAIVNVIQNRLKNPRRYGRTAKKVVTKKYAFSAYADKALMARNYKQVKPIADKLVANIGKLPDITGGADHYMTKAMYNKKMQNPNSWVQKMEVTKTIGNHVFMKEKTK